ncbi:gamma-glutamyltransferase [Olivibacter sitiensis]|uniref:gamma-glutamyltransferase n=1 Tax=Olivibacter sitiensis TaxID=376470 RepID=UPI0003FC9AF6|nr:gamma-glutamyltransferase [Olivibacter sitiensis]
MVKPRQISIFCIKVPCFNRSIVILLLGIALCQFAYAKQDTAYRNGMVVSAHPIASQVGIDVLKKGGNAVDAAIAVKFALAVVYPNAGNIGGGGFMVFRSSQNEYAALDFREKAPGMATRDMYLDETGEPVSRLSLDGHLAVGVPGSVDGMVKAHERYGKLLWKDLLQPAVDLARKGFPLTEMQANELNRRKESFKRFNSHGTALINEKADWKAGDLLIQKELAKTMKRIQSKGRRGFYEGKVAKLLVREMKDNGGIISLEDLKNYEAKWREPVANDYRGYHVVSMPPSSSGGIALLSLLKSVEPYPLSHWGFQQDSTVQVMVEAERRVYADRAEHYGDADFYPVPLAGLLDSNYIHARMQDISFERATSSESVSHGKPVGYESEETTHFSVVDKDGNAVAITTTLNNSYGSLVVVKGAGFLLNDEMDDFSMKPGVPNLYGLLGGKANAIEANKRMLSAMTPTIVTKDGKLLMVVGTPGGSTIITSVFQVILNVVDFGMGMQEAVSAPRFHHQWLPDNIQPEKEAIAEDVRARLEAKGYQFVQRGNIGRVDAILVKADGTLEGGADHRGDDTIVGY